MLLIAAVVMDFKYDKIYNGWIVFGVFIGFVMRILIYGRNEFFTAGAAVLISFCLLYPIYKINALGAGDVKLYIMAASFLSVNRLLHVIVISFLIGAVFSIGKMISEENFKERMQYLFSYLSDVVYAGQWKLYGENLKDDYRQYKSNKIHFALPICLSVILGLGGLF